MDSAAQVMFVLQVIVSLGPLAVYFLGLGLVNSQAHPCLIRAGVDFVLLAVAFIPVIIAPVVVLISQGHVWLACSVALLVLVLFAVMMPKGRGAWVIYNVEPRECRRLVERACRRLGWEVIADHDGLRVPGQGLVIREDALPWLRNVTLRLSTPDPSSTAPDRLISTLAAEMTRMDLLPSPTGASLVIIGASLLGFPMWYVFQNFSAIVDVVKQMLFA